MDVSRKGREKDRSRKVEGRTIQRDNEARKDTKERPKGNNESYPGGFGKIRVLLVTFTNKFYASDNIRLKWEAFSC